MHNVNGVELTDAQFEEYNKLSTPAEKADYLERHKQLANTASQESKDAGMKEAEKTSATGSVSRRNSLWDEGGKSYYDYVLSTEGEDAANNFLNIAEAANSSDMKASLAYKNEKKRIDKLKKKQSKDQKQEHENQWKKEQAEWQKIIEDNTKGMNEDEKKKWIKANKKKYGFDNNWLENLFHFTKEDNAIVEDAQEYVNSNIGSSSSSMLENAKEIGRTNALTEASGDIAAVPPSAIRANFDIKEAEAELRKQHPDWSEDEIQQQVSYWNGTADKPTQKAAETFISNKTGESKEPDILNMTADYYSNSDITAQDVVNAAKEKGWTEEKTTAYFEKLGGVSDNAKKALASAYGQKKTTGGSGSGSGNGNGTGTTPPPDGDDGITPPPDGDDGITPPPPTEDVEVEPVATKEEAKSQIENIDAAVKELEEQLANAPDEVTRQELEVRLKNAKHAQELYNSMLTLTDEEIKDRYGSRTSLDNEITRQRAGGMVNYYKKEKNLLKDKIAKAKEAGDEKLVAKYEQELKDLKSEKGFFIADAIGTALTNMGRSVQGKDANVQSQWEQKQGDIIKAETDRWNQHHDEQMKAIDADFTQKYAEDDARRAAWNDIKKDEAAQMAAKRLGLLDDTFNAEAAIGLQKLFGSMSTSDALITMAQMNDYGVEDMAAFVLGRAAKAGNLNLEEVVGNLGSIISNLGDAAGDLSGSLSKLVEYLTTNGEKHGLKFWEWGS